MGILHLRYCQSKIPWTLVKDELNYSEKNKFTISNFLQKDFFHMAGINNPIPSRTAYHPYANPNRELNVPSNLQSLSSPSNKYVSVRDESTLSFQIPLIAAQMQEALKYPKQFAWKVYFASKEISYYRLLENFQNPHYKTKYCWFLVNQGKCTKGSDCNFAHSYYEIMFFCSQIDASYKTMPCIFLKEDICPDHSSCHNVHLGEIQRKFTKLPSGGFEWRYYRYTEEPSPEPYQNEPESTTSDTFAMTLSFTPFPPNFENADLSIDDDPEAQKWVAELVDEPAEEVSQGNNTICKNNTNFSEN